MLFTVIKMGLKGRSLAKNPNEFVKGEIQETALSVIIFPMVVGFAFIVTSFLLGYTHYLGNPSLLARIIFWILLVGYSFVSVPMYFLYRVVRRLSRAAGNQTEKLFVKAEIKE